LTGLAHKKIVILTIDWQVISGSLVRVKI